jgi:putative PIN family toxin of toxin-antitoxin system
LFGVTADTNVYISALIFGGVPDLLLEAAREGSVRLSVSRDILGEISRVLGERFGWQNDATQETLSEIVLMSELVQPARRIDAIVDDPSDNRILECAVAAGSDFIVSGDRHLLRLRRFEGIEIVKVADFLRIQERGGSAEGVGFAT